MQNEVDAGADVYARNVFLMKPFNQSRRVESWRPNKDDCYAAIHSPSTLPPLLLFPALQLFARQSVCQLVRQRSSLVAFILWFFAVCPFYSSPFLFLFFLPFSINRKWAFVLATSSEQSPQGGVWCKKVGGSGERERAALAKFMQSSF